MFNDCRAQSSGAAPRDEARCPLRPPAETDGRWSAAVTRIAVVTPNWNGGSLAVESAQSVTKQTVGTKLFLIDNASLDGSGEAIARACPEVELIRNRKNLGFAAAVNQGLRAARGFEYTLLLNNDVVFKERDLATPLE